MEFDPDSFYGTFAYNILRISSTIHLLRCQAWSDQEHLVFHKFQVLNMLSFKNMAMFQAIFKRIILL